MRKGFTIVELIIVIAILAIVLAILLPQLTSGYDKTKEEIINVYNGKQIQVIDVDTKEILYQGDKDNLQIDGYTLVDIEYGEQITMYMKSIE